MRLPSTADAAIETKRKECGKERMRLPSTADAAIETKRKECGLQRMRLPSAADAAKKKINSKMREREDKIATSS